MRGRTSNILPVYSPSAPPRGSAHGVEFDGDVDDAKLGSQSKAGSSLRLLFTRLLLGRAVGRRRVQRAQGAAFVLAFTLIALALLLLRWTLRVSSPSPTPVLLLTPSPASGKAGKARPPVRRAPLPPDLPTPLRLLSAMPGACAAG